VGAAKRQRSGLFLGVLFLLGRYLNRSLVELRMQAAVDAVVFPHRTDGKPTRSAPLLEKSFSYMNQFG
jgi:hypothetical protein